MKTKLKILIPILILILATTGFIAHYTIVRYTPESRGKISASHTGKNIRIAVVWPDTPKDTFILGVNTAVEEINNNGGLVLIPELLTKAKFAGDILGHISNEQDNAFFRSCYTREEGSDKFTLKEVTREQIIKLRKILKQIKYGKKIKLIKKVYKGDFNNEKQITKVLVKDKELIAVIGHRHSDTAMYASIVYEANGVLFIATGSTASALIRREFNYTFRIIPNDGDIGKGILKFINLIIYPEVTFVKLEYFEDDLLPKILNPGDRNFIKRIFTYEPPDNIDKKKFEIYTLNNLSNPADKQYIRDVYRINTTGKYVLNRTAAINYEEVKGIFKKAGYPPSYYSVNKDLLSREELKKLYRIRMEAGYNKTNAVIIHEQGAYGRNLAAIFKKESKYNNITILKTWTYSNNQTDFFGIASDLKKYRFEVILLAGAFPEAKDLIITLRKMNVNTPIIGGDGLNYPSILADLGKYAENVYYTAFSNPRIISDLPEAEKDENRPFHSLRSLDYPKDAYRLLLGYDSVWFLADAMMNTNSILPPAISSYLKYNTQWNGYTGKISFSPDGELKSNRFYIKTFKNNREKTIAQIDPPDNIIRDEDGL